MSYTPITNAEIDPDSPLTTGLFSKLRDNTEFGRNPVTGEFIDSGFTNDSISGNRLQINSMNGDRIINNTVGQAQIGANAVHQSELSTGEDTQTFSVTAGATASSNFGAADNQTLTTEPDHGLDVRTEITLVSGNSGRAIFTRGSAGGSSIGTLTRRVSLVAFLNQTGGGITPKDFTGECRGRYVSNSPPNTIKGQSVELIVYVRRDSEGVVNGAAALETPPWVYNGPTKNNTCRTEAVRDKKGKLINLKKFTLDRKSFVPHPDDGGDLDEWLASMEQVEYEVTEERKEADINLIAHPYELREGETVCLVDPFSPLMGKLLELHKAGESVPKLFHKGYLELTKEIDCAKPDTVTACGLRWKNTRRT